MIIPNGLTCADCVHVKRCADLVDFDISRSKWCSVSPTRFLQDDSKIQFGEKLKWSYSEGCESAKIGEFSLQIVHFQADYGLYFMDDLSPDGGKSLIASGHETRDEAKQYAERLIERLKESLGGTNDNQD